VSVGVHEAIVGMVVVQNGYYMPLLGLEFYYEQFFELLNSICSFYFMINKDLLSYTKKLFPLLSHGFWIWENFILI